MLAVSAGAIAAPGGRPRRDRRIARRLHASREGSGRRRSGHQGLQGHPLRGRHIGPSPPAGAPACPVARRERRAGLWPRLAASQHRGEHVGRLPVPERLDARTARRRQAAGDVYIHGGAYSNGSGSSPLYDGVNLCRRGNVVVVTVNHRLNAFGYLFLQRLAADFPDSGNCGQLDLVQALEMGARQSRNSVAIPIASSSSASRAAAPRSRP